MSQMFSPEDYAALPDRTAIRTVPRHRAFYRDPNHPEMVFQCFADPMDLREYSWSAFDWQKPVARFDVSHLVYVGGPLYEELSDPSAADEVVGGEGFEPPTLSV